MHLKPTVKPIVVIGLGKTGLSCVSFLRKHNHSVIVIDTRENPPELASCQALFPECPVHLGKIDPEILEQADKVVLSPGLSPKLPAIEQARLKGIPIIGDIELFAHYAKAPIIAITGTNGKSTVTSLVGELLAAVGLRVQVGGNLGTPALELLKDGTDYYVLELSSFQLDLIYSLRPKVAALLNITPDHLDRHGNYESYIKSKRNIYHDAEHSVFNRADGQTRPESMRFATSFGLDQATDNHFGILIQEGIAFLAQGSTAIAPVSSLHITGKHNWSNALAALAIVSACGIALEDCISALQAFPGLEHRCQWIAAIDGVNWYNDSKGTNVGACCSAIQGLGDVINGKIVLIAGGQSKGASFDALRNVLQPYVREVIVMGEDGQKIADAIHDLIPIQGATNLQQAVLLAQASAKPNDAVLLSPACASFDSFKNYEERGYLFAQFVRALTLIRPSGTFSQGEKE
jgi:UDP-N-acetylmuramoylalanine--D-glutamate ligase